MKRVFLNLLSAVLLFGNLYAQDAPADPAGKDIVFIESFSYPNNIGSNVVQSLRNKVIEGINLTNRIKLLDSESDPILKAEKSRRSQESAINEENANLESMKTLGAKYVISGHVVSMEAVREKDSSGNVSYTGSVVYQLKVYDLSNGTIIATKDFNQSGLTGGVGSTTMEAITDAFKSTKLNMERFVDEVFKLEGKIEEIAESKKDEAKKVYINLGELRGIQKGQKFDVFVAREVAGRKTRKLIGELQVDAVEADDLSLASVKKGGKDIMAAIGEGKVLTVESKKDTNAMKDIKGFFSF